MDEPRSQEAKKPKAKKPRSQKPRSQEATKPRSQEATKPQSQEATKPRSQEATRSHQETPGATTAKDKNPPQKKEFPPKNPPITSHKLRATPVEAAACPMRFYATICSKIGLKRATNYCQSTPEANPCPVCLHFAYSFMFLGLVPSKVNSSFFTRIRTLASDIIKFQP